MTDFVGTRKRLTITVTDETLQTPALADPTTLSVRWSSPAGTTTTKTYPTDGQVVHDGVGSFHIDIDCPDPGQWAAYISSTGVVGATGTTWTIEPAPA